MKKIVLAIALLGGLCASAAGQSAPNDSISAAVDTITSINGAQSVSVIRSGNKSVVTVIGSDANPKNYYSYVAETAAPQIGESEWGLSLPFLTEKRHKKAELLWFNQLYVGFAFPVSAPDGLDQSVATGIGKIFGVRFSPWRRGPKFSIGAGIHFEQYTLHGGQVFGLNRKALEILPAEEGARDIHNRLENFGFSVPVTISQSIYKDFAIAVGAELNFNTYTKASSKYTIGEVEYQQKFKHLQQRILTPTLYASIGWLDEFGLYFRYTPQSLFEKQWGPDFSAISFGVTLGL